MLILQSESTASRRRLYFQAVDATDGITPEPGLTGTGWLSKNGAAPVATSGSIVEISAANAPGRYYIELTVAECDTLGGLEFRYKAAACAEVVARGQVVALNPYVSAATAVLDAQHSAHNVNGSVGQSLQPARTGVLQSANVQSVILDAGASAQDDFYNGNFLVFAPGTAAVQGELIADYDGATREAFLQSQLPVAPADNAPYVMLAGPDVVTPTAISDAVLDAMLADHQTAGSVGKGISDASAGGDPMAVAVPGAYAPGTAGHVIGTNLNGEVAPIKTVADAIKARTDLLQFTGTDVKATLEGELVGLIDGAITPAKVATDAVDADALADDAITAIVAAIRTDLNASGVTAAALATAALTAIRQEIEAGLLAVVAVDADAAADAATTAAANAATAAANAATAIARGDTIIGQTDSLEQSLTDMKGPAFNLATDSLEALADAIGLVGGGGATAAAVVDEAVARGVELADALAAAPRWNRMLSATAGRWTIDRTVTPPLMTVYDADNVTPLFQAQVPIDTTTGQPVAFTPI